MRTRTLTFTLDKEWWGQHSQFLRCLMWAAEWLEQLSTFWWILSSNMGEIVFIPKTHFKILASELEVLIFQTFLKCCTNVLFSPSDPAWSGVLGTYLGKTWGKTGVIMYLLFVFVYLSCVFVFVYFSCVFVFVYFSCVFVFVYFSCVFVFVATRLGSGDL